MIFLVYPYKNMINLAVIKLMESLGFRHCVAKKNITNKQFIEALFLVNSRKNVSIDSKQRNEALKKKSFKKQSDNYLKYILNVKRSKLAYIILLLVIVPRVLWMTKDVIPEATLFQINFKVAIYNFLDDLDFYYWVY